MKKIMSLAVITALSLVFIGCSVKTEHNYYNQDGKKFKSETSKEKYQRSNQ